MLEIRQATGVDLPRIIDLLETCQLPTEDVPGIVDSFFLARTDSDVVGVIALERLTSVGLLRSLAVPPQFRERGIGRRLCDHVIDSARAQGFAYVYLLTTDADGYFSHLGFRVADRAGAPEAIRATSQFRELCPESAKLMRLRLTVWSRSPGLSEE
jgi:amino-acid N-acetyltransferase